MKCGLYEEVIIAGFGGQGVILLGKLLATTAMKAGFQVTYMPSYGAEVRGGTANCMVIIADEPIASPLVSRPSSLIVMNKASLNKFAPRLQPGGLLVMNRSLIEGGPDRCDVEVIAIPADEIAVGIDAPKSANMVALGAYLQKRGICSIDMVAASLPDVLAPRLHQTIPANVEALRRGGNWPQNSGI